MMLAKQSTAATLIIGPILDSTGAEYNGAVIGDISISKNNSGTLTPLASAATLTSIANGQYTLVLTTGNTDTLGRAQFSCNKVTYQMPPLELMVIPSSVFDALVTNATNSSGGLPAATGAISALAGAISTYAGGAVASVTAGVTVTTNNDKTGYSLTQSFPANFASLAITAGGIVSADVQTIKTQAVTCAAGVTILASVGTATVGSTASALSTAQTGITTLLVGVNLNASQHVIVDSGTVTTVTNQLTGAAIATAIWQDTTAGDFTTANSIGKSLYTGVAPGNQFGGIVTNNSPFLPSAIVTSGSVTFSNGITANITGNLSGSVGSVTGLTASDVGAIKAKTDQLSFNGSGNVAASAGGTDFVHTAGLVWALDSGGNALSGSHIDQTWTRVLQGVPAATPGSGAGVVICGVNAATSFPSGLSVSVLATSGIVGNITGDLIGDVRGKVLGTTAGGGTIGGVGAWVKDGTGAAIPTAAANATATAAQITTDHGSGGYATATGFATPGDVPSAAANAAAVLAAAVIAPIAADIKSINSTDVTGDGSVGDPWGPV